MNFTSAKIEDLIKWWSNQNDSYQAEYLCLLVGGHLTDSRFFESIISNAHPLDTISGSKVLIFLFLDTNMEDTIRFSNSQNEIIVPGKFVGSNRKYQDEEISYLRVTELEMYHKKVFDQLAVSSQAKSHDISEYFNLKRTEIPCIILVDKKNDFWVISTRGEADVKSFYEFLRKLSSLVEEIPDLGKYRFYKSLSMLKEEHRKALVEIEDKKAKSLEEKNHLKNIFKQYNSILISQGIPKDVCEKYFQVEKANQFNQFVDHIYKRRPNALIENDHKLRQARAISQVALLEKEILESSQKIKELERHKKYLINSMKDIEINMEATDSMTDEFKKELESKTEKLKKLDGEVQRLCDKFESRFVWKSKITPVTDFLKKLVGYSSRAKDMLSISEKINKLVE